MNMMYIRDIKVIGIKPHTCHLSQPLDKNPFASLKDSFNSEMCKYNQMHDTKALAKEHFFQVFNVAWGKSMTKRNIQAGFKHTGLWPPNRGAIKPEQLGPSAVSDECKLCIVKLKFMFESFFLDFGSVFKKKLIKFQKAEPSHDGYDNICKVSTVLQFLIH